MYQSVFRIWIRKFFGPPGSILHATGCQTTWHYCTVGRQSHAKFSCASIQCTAASFLQALCKNNYLKETSLKNLSFYLTYVLGKANPSTLTMVKSNLMIQPLKNKDCTSYNSSFFTVILI